MAKNQNSNLRKKEKIVENKSFIQYKEGIFSKRLTKISLKFLLILIFYNSISLTGENSLEIRRLENQSKITMIINGEDGETQILGDSFSDSSYEVQINGKHAGSSPNKAFNLANGPNNVTLIFDKEITSCANMFSNIKNLLEIDLSNFDSSKVINMEKMFYGCVNLTKINFTNINTANAINMNNMFYNCKKLTSLDISNFNTDKVEDMCSMFKGCSSLKVLYLSNFNTSSVTDMNSMFYGCHKLTSLDISSFKTEKVEDMGEMFKDCSSLIELDLSNFNTLSAESMSFMFSGCEKLIFLDISNFNTEKVEDMGSMFESCSSLINLDLSHFNTPEATNMASMFSGCKKLIYLDLSSFDTSNVKNMDSMFYGCSSLKSLDISNFKPTNSENMKEMFGDCENLIYLDISKFIIQTDEFDNIFKNCGALKFVKLNSKSKKNFDKFIGLFINDKYIITFCYSENEDSNLFDIIDRNNKCNNPCFKKSFKMILETQTCIENCESNDKYQYEYNNFCYENCPEGSFLFDNKCKNCYYKCKNCLGSGNEINNNCSECLLDMVLLNDYNKNNCYQKCDNYYYFDEKGEYFCTEALECPKGYNISTENSTRCVKINKTETNKEIKNKDDKISNFKEDIINNEEVLDIVKEGEDYIKKEDDIIFHVTTSESQKNNKNKTISSIDLKDCEKILQDVYNISEPLIIIKVDYYPKDINIPIIGYEIYHPVNKSKLDLNYCKDTSIQLNIPVNIDETKLYKYDPNSEYYTDDCSSYTSDNGTDILINDRKKEFISNNMSLCESNCDYDSYSKEDKQSICNCKVKNGNDLLSQTMNNSQKLSNSFSTEESHSKASNLLSLKCTNALFNKNGLIKNISSYIISASMIYFLLSILLFIKCGYPLMVKQIKEIVNSKKENKSKKQTNKETNKKKSNRENQSDKKNNKKKGHAPPKKSNMKKAKHKKDSKNIQ